VSTKRPQALCHKIRQENALKIGWMNFPLNISYQVQEGNPLCGHKMFQVATRGCYCRLQCS
jgi:hypothetical protein